MRYILLSAVAAASLIPAAAFAQSDPGTGISSGTLRGIRVEANAGGDWFKSQGKTNNRFGYGATIGFDGIIANRFVLGPEASYWNTSRRLSDHAATARVRQGRLRQCGAVGHLHQLRRIFVYQRRPDRSRLQQLPAHAH